MTPQELAAKIPAITKADLVFPGGPLITKPYDELSPIAREWEKKNPKNWGTRVFADLFYEGGHIPKPKAIEGLSEDDVHRVIIWTRAAMGSFYPAHEDKTALCGMLFEIFCEEPPSEGEDQ